uniref:F-box associated domain-containing protein n=1 Tax=Leersia perrieri TaxID=77586 RepID=A0A0D9XHY3_9ORYZ
MATSCSSFRLAVFNPMTGDMVVLPCLSGQDCPGSYACAILTGEDLDNHDHNFFRVLLIYSRPSFTALRCYSSNTAHWGLERRKPGRKMRQHTLQQLGHAVVVGGVAYLPLLWEAFGVRLSDPTTMDVCSVPYMEKGNLPDFRILGVSPDGKELRALCRCGEKKLVIYIPRSAFL